MNSDQRQYQTTMLLLVVGLLITLIAEASFATVLGFVAQLLIAILLLIPFASLFRRNRFAIQDAAVLFAVLFLVYYAVSVYSTHYVFPREIFVSRAAPMVWLLIGYFVMAQIDHPRIHSNEINVISNLPLFGILFATAVMFLASKQSNEQAYYQSVADNLIILFFVNMIFIEKFSKTVSDLTKNYSIFSLLAVCAIYLASQLGSSNIALFGFLIVGWAILRMVETRVHGSIAVGVVFCLAFIALILAVILYWLGLLDGFLFSAQSSINSRIKSLLTFDTQYSVAPIFGHPNAELVSNIGRGYYVHSILLSALTHTGVLGTVILLTSMLIPIATMSLKFRNLQKHRQLAFLLLLSCFAFGSMIAFFTWPPFWFSLGLAIRASKSNEEFNLK